MEALLTAFGGILHNEDHQKNCAFIELSTPFHKYSNPSGGWGLRAISLSLVATSPRKPHP